LSEILRYTFDKIIDNTVCEFWWKIVSSRLGLQIDINKDMICDSAAEEKSSCKGDSGGPSTTSIHKKRIQIGLVSFGIPICKIAIPSVNTRITSYLDWIRKNSPDFPADFLKYLLCWEQLFWFGLQKS
jgi:hypothetical protein